MEDIYYITGKLEQSAEDIEAAYSTHGVKVKAFEMAEEDFISFVKEGAYKGIIIGMPYGCKVQAFADEEDFGYQRTRAANILYKEDGEIIIDNTDLLAILRALSLVHAKLNGKKVLVLGRGAAAKAVREAMRERHAGVCWQVPKHEIPFIAKKADAEILINATPAEMEIDLDLFPQLELVMDLIPKEETKLLQRAKDKNIPVINGKTIFQLQAEMSARLLEE